MKKCSIKKVNNGYILTVTDQGKSVLKTEYETPVFVFSDFAELMDFVSKEFREDE
jgi:hypothetical protein